MNRPLEQIICDHFNIPWNSVVSKRRDDYLVNARLIYFHIAITETGIKDIADKLNVHRSELYHYKKVFRDKMISAKFAHDYYTIEKEYYTWSF